MGLSEVEVSIFEAGATLGITIHGFTIAQGPHFILKFEGFLAKVLEIHGFTGTQGTRPNAAPVR